MRQRDLAAEQVADLLRTARRSLGLNFAFLSRMDGTTQHLEVVDTPLPSFVLDGLERAQDTSFCQAIRDGRLPAVMPNVKDFPEAMKLPAARMPRIRSFISVPVVLSDGSVYGTFCAGGFTADAKLSDRDEALMSVLAHAAAVIIEPDVHKRRRNAELEERYRPLIEAGGPAVLLQPIIDLATGRRVGAEALSRFPQHWNEPPDESFADAGLIGERDRLEIQALRSAAAHLDRVSGYVAMNVSPATLMTGECQDALSAMPLSRVVLELSEHDPVEDYDALHAVLAPLRARGMRLAIDDVGSGYSSLRHIVVTRPDVIKLDRGIVTGLQGDSVLPVVVRSLVDLAAAVGAVVVAEGVETAGDATTLAALGVHLGQGWHFDRAVIPSELRETYGVMAPV
ncbi:sensor domain-containing phosphodiesterase [Paractinoplanes atraurantiacus]|uniref:EAL domain, c-di-GMP-specific phosphodiesterase class I (Or its enzymatically inactive variant) n=1 Tax=Paractinoplanes atraurantiacus TaxID=1036182 RepID=A0A285HQM1_9ACTN|nr:EAL domain-containing protein [Actinoplanes atraurantiacus]SNY38008.1 EAL domain, c-di-GMP-specific phosphodiesterase class I (or its enzymatically inactive variant) [Actinoplanes atraurantiacus]